MSIFNYLAGKNWQDKNTSQRAIYVPSSNPSPICSCNLGRLAGVKKNLNNYVHEPSALFIQTYTRPNYLIFGNVPLFNNTKIQGAYAPPTS